MRELYYVYQLGETQQKMMTNSSTTSATTFKSYECAVGENRLKKYQGGENEAPVRSKNGSPGAHQAVQLMKLILSCRYVCIYVKRPKLGWTISLGGIAYDNSQKLQALHTSDS